MDTSHEEWWLDFFDADYRRLWAPVLGPERTELEVESIAALIEGLGAPLEIIDVCGGDGRVARPLAEAGHRLTVVDTSQSMLAHGRHLDPTLNWVQADAYALPFAGVFDVALNLFTSFGFAPRAQSPHFFAGIARALKPGGLFIMDLVHRDFLASLGPQRTWYELAGGARVLRSFDFDPIESCTHESLELVGDTLARAWSVQIYTATEITLFLQGAGLQPLAYFADFNLEAFEATSPRLIIVAERAGGAHRYTTPSSTTWRRGLRCPMDGQALVPAVRGRHASAEVQPDTILEGLLTADGQRLYPIKEGILELLPTSGLSPDQR